MSEATAKGTTIDEAIQHCKEVSLCTNHGCACNYKHLAKWLKELKERRESDLRPATKYLANDVTEQMEHIIEELGEAVEAIAKVVDDGCKTELPHAAEELIDLQTSCETMLCILGLDEQQRRDARKMVIEKNAKRGYYEP